MTMMTKTRTRKNHGCGCGSGCDGSCGGCTHPAGGGTCGNCSDVGFSRPRFFAGQLLTDEDLQAVVDYVVQKRRLTNRHLFGDGVVCGLRVTRDPCDPNKTLVVGGGHALDCCGNDIVVPCPVTLDIFAMIRELRTKKRGQDCGDPCAEDEAIDTSLAKGREGDEAPLRKYDLYIRYCESLTDPVVPYMTEDPCNVVTCEATRVREGYAFELRCHEDPASPADLSVRAAACRDKLRRLETMLESHGARTLAFATAWRTSKVNALRLRSSGLTTSEVTEMVAVLDDLRVVSVAEGPLDKKAAIENISLAKRYLASRAAIELAANRPAILEQEDIKRFVDEGPRIARQVFEASRSRLGVLASPIDEALVSFFDEGFDLLQHDVLDPLQIEALAAELPINLVTASQVMRGVSELHATTRELFATPGVITDLALREEFAEIDPGAFVLGEDLTDAQMTLAVNQSVQVVAVIQRSFEQCLCEEIPPPCPPCDDPAVRIACIEVRECEIYSVCNLCRKIVLSFPNLLYWIPGDEKISAALEKFCCGRRKQDVSDDRTSPIFRADARLINHMLASPKDPSQPILIDPGERDPKALPITSLRETTEMLRLQGGRDLTGLLTAMEGPETRILSRITSLEGTTAGIDRVKEAEIRSLVREELGRLTQPRTVTAAGQGGKATKATSKKAATKKAAKKAASRKKANRRAT